MKKLFIMMFGLLFTASAVFASPNAKVEFDTISKADSQILFGSSTSIRAVTLGNEEMLHTNAKGWFSRLRKRLSRVWVKNRHRVYMFATGYALNLAFPGAGFSGKLGKIIWKTTF